MKIFVAKTYLLAGLMLMSVACYSTPEDYAFYLKVGSGISVSQSANVVAPYPPFAQAYQGYDASLGHCAIAGLGIGAEFFKIFDLEVNISNRSVFHYDKYQTSIVDGQSYTREFDLNVTPILFSVNILGQNIPHLHHDFGCGKIYPMLGGGVGMSNLLITNFRTTGLPATGDSSPFASFSSENQYTLRKNFTYTILTGFEYHHNDRWAIGTGYRWLNAGSFAGPQYLRADGGPAVDLGDDTWQMRFRANEWFIEFKIFI
jgi:opacity protein-like surface antigen